MAPMTRSRANTAAVQSPLAAQYYAARADAGLLLTEGTGPSAMGMGYARTPGIYNAEQVAAWIPECLLSQLSCFDESSYLIGQFYWELSDIAAIHECGLSLVHEIWVATEYLRDVYRRRVTVPV